MKYDNKRLENIFFINVVQKIDTKRMFFFIYLVQKIDTKVYFFYILCTEN